MKREGDCFEANGNFIVEIFQKHSKDERQLQQYRLCHGMVKGAKGSLVEGRWFPHAWIEVNKDVIMDFSNNKRIIGRIDKVRCRINEDSVKRYTVKQIIQNILETEHYGPWE